LTAAIAVINGLLSLMAAADRFGVNLDLVRSRFDQAKAEGRDVHVDEVQEMADQATDSGNGLQSIIDNMSE